MIDPLSAIGLASSIVSFVDFGSKLVSDGYKLYESGSLGGLDELELVTQDLVSLANGLATDRSLPTKSLKADDGVLRELAISCRSVADQLLNILVSLKPRTQHDGLESFRKALRKAKKKGAIENLERRLQKIQNQLNIRLIAMLSNKQSDILSALDLLTAESQRNGIDIANKLDSLRFEALAAAQKQQKQPKHLRGLLMTHDDVGKIVLACNNLAGEAKGLANSQRILKSLHYQQEREAQVKDAQLHTFEWIFDDTLSGTGPKTRFVEWMESGSGIYWIAGKAGSGKSTLVKYIHRHARTLEALENWAGPSRLVCASHFFWSAGNKMQKSQIGLLHSLLYQVLGQFPSLIEIVCPKRWTKDSFTEENPEPWSLRELSEAFQSLVGCTQYAHATKFCFFVDGLDEYDGEHADIIHILQTMTKSPNIKICVSSRPWNVFEKAFGGQNFYRLLLQEFTCTDIELYVRASLETDDGFSSLAKQDDRYQQLIQEIVTKAQGVFLWVFLVVRSLLRGLVDENEFSVLQRRLDHLPSDLEEYFFHIFDTVEPIYREQTARIFQVAMHSKKSLPAIALFFLDQEKIDPEYASKLKLHSLPENDVVEISRRMKKRVNACCKDLLEINVVPYEDSFLQYRIDFLHRTVRDFLMTKDMAHLLSQTTSDFDPHVSLCRIILSQIKTYPLTIVKSSKNQALMSMIHELLQYACEAEVRHGVSQHEIIDELHRVLSITAINRKKMGPFPTSYDGILRDYDLSILLNLAIQNNLKLYVSAKLNQKQILPPCQIGQKPLLYHALHLHRDDHLTMWDADIEMVKIILDHGADINEKEKGERCTVWESYLIRCIEKRHQRPYQSRQREAFLIAEMLLQYGANTALKIPTNMVGDTRTAWPKLRAGSDGGEFEVKVPNRLTEYKTVQEILEETFPRDAFRVRKLLAENRRSRLRRWFW